MPITNIPAKPPFLPRIPNESGVLPQEGREFTINSQTVDESGYIFERLVTVTHVQKWKMIFSQFLKCGQSVTYEKDRKIGISRTTTSELASKLGVSFEGLGAELGAKLGVSITINDEDVTKVTIPTRAKECKSHTFVVWQLIDVFYVDIIDEYNGWPPSFTFNYRFEVPLDKFASDDEDFVDAECCSEEVVLQKREGFDCPYVIDFNGNALVLLGKTTDSGHVQFADSLNGEFQLGGLVSYSALNPALRNEITLTDNRPELTFGTIGLLDYRSGFYCNELNLINQAGFERSQARILEVFNLPKTEFLTATGGVGEGIIDRLIAVRGIAGFDSLRTIETLQGFTRAELYQLVVPILTQGYVQITKIPNGLVDVINPIDNVGFSSDTLNKQLSDLPMLGPSTVEDIRVKLGAVKVGDLVAIGVEPDSDSTADGSQLFNPNRLRSELKKANLQRGLTNLPDSDIDGVIEAIMPEKRN
jgi:hypothetical protein